jgi:hypothetical protein
MPAIFGRDPQKQNGALLIAACVVAAIRLRGEPIERQSAKFRMARHLILVRNRLNVCIHCKQTNMDA